MNRYVEVNDSMRLIFFIFCSFVIVANPAWAIEQRGDLALIKEPLDESLGSDTCGGTFDVHSGEDVPSMKGFRHYFCSGRYTLTFSGDKGSLVTIFGLGDFEKANGFMVIRKMDDRKVWLTDLEAVPSGKWVRRKPTSDSGGVQIYYSSGTQFSQRLSSVKWGKWWEGRNPN